MFFITFTCYQWLSLIDTINGYEIIYKWFDHLKSKGHFINGYVIMPNHVHALISFINCSTTDAAKKDFNTHASRPWASDAG